MKKEATQLSSRCFSLVLVELAKKPGTPMEIKTRTGLTKNNYVNIILKRLKSKGIVKCLNPEEKTGNVLCINPVSAKRVEKMFVKKGIKQKVNPLPNLIWTAYGRLLCRCYTQMRRVFKSANEIRLEGREISVANLKEKLPGMPTGDIYRALYKFVKLGVISLEDAKLRKFIITEEGLAIIEFDPKIL